MYSPDGCAPTLSSGEREGANIQPSVLVEALPFNTTQVTSRQNGSNPQWGDPCHTLAAKDHPPAVCMGFKYEQGAKARGVGAESEQAPTMTTEKPPAVCYSIVENAIGREAKNGPNGKEWHEEVSPTLNTFGAHAVAFAWNSGMLAGGSVGDEVSPTLRAAHSGEPAVVCTQYGEEIAGTLTARHDSSPCADRGQNVVCMADDTAHAAVDDDMCGTISAHSAKDAPVVMASNGGDVVNALCASDYKGVGNQFVNDGKVVAFAAPPRYIVRRLMPVECERLQGFPDGWTDLGGTADAPRYRALGNSMAVPVIRWLGERIEAVDAL